MPAVSPAAFQPRPSNLAASHRSRSVRGSPPNAGTTTCSIRTAIAASPAAPPVGAGTASTARAAAAGERGRWSLRAASWRAGGPTSSPRPDAALPARSLGTSARPLPVRRRRRQPGCGTRGAPCSVAMAARTANPGSGCSPRACSCSLPLDAVEALPHRLPCRSSKHGVALPTAKTFEKLHCRRASRLGTRKPSGCRLAPPGASTIPGSAPHAPPCPAALSRILSSCMLVTNWGRCRRLHPRDDGTPAPATARATPTATAPAALPRTARRCRVAPRAGLRWRRRRAGRQSA